MRFLDYGKNKDGYWNYKRFQQQMDDMLDCMECLHPGYQVVMEMDWTSGHAHHRAGCLSANTMNVGYGGKHAIPHQSTVTAACLGPGPKTLQPGDVQYFHFRTAEEKDGAAPDGPPWYKQGADDYLGEVKGMKHILWERGLWVPGMVEKIPEENLFREQSMSMRHVLSQCEDFQTR